MVMMVVIVSTLIVVLRHFLMSHLMMLLVIHFLMSHLMMLLVFLRHFLVRHLMGWIVMIRLIIHMVIWLFMLNVRFLKANAWLIVIDSGLYWFFMRWLCLLDLFSLC
jgi:hypothetical protein